MLIIGLVGEIASGKSTFSDFVWDNYGITTLSMREAYETPGVVRNRSARGSRLDRSRILDEIVARTEQGVSKTTVARNFVHQILGSKIKEFYDARNAEVLVVSDITRMVECQFLRDLEYIEGFEIIALEHLDIADRWQRYTTSSGTSLLDRNGFEECDKHESGLRNSQDKKDWAADLLTVSTSAPRKLSNAGTIVEFQSKISALLQELGISVENGTADKGAYVVNHAHIPNSIQRVRELQRRHLASRFLEAFYALQPPSLPLTVGLAETPAIADENKVLQRMIDALSRLEITDESNFTDQRRSLSSLLGPRSAVREINNQFMYRLVKVFLTESTTEALDAFKAIPFSTSQEEVLVGCLNETEFVKCHKVLHEFLQATQGEIHNYAATTFVESRDDCDRIQKNGDGTRSLDVMLSEGLHLSLMAGSVEEIAKAQQDSGNGPIPVLELMKSRRVLQLAGLENSKVSHAIHDALDHIWFFDLLRRAGVLKRHEELFNRLGAPQDWDLFQRAGECVASISFGVRLFANQPAGFVPLHSVFDIERDVSEAALQAGGLEKNHIPAFKKLRELTSQPQSLESQSLAFVWSNYLVELNEQRRKDGEILERTSGAGWSPLDPRSIDYLSFFIDGHTELHNPKNKHRDNLFRVHLSLEEYFASSTILEGAGKILKWSELSDPNAEFLLNSSLPAKRIEWMAKHYGFTALRDSAI